MQGHDSTTSTHEPEGSQRIWVNANYFLRVDAQGYLMGMCYEGALGCVLPLLSAFDHNRLALKIPRMLADTVRENAFISQVVNAEAAIVYRANEEYKAAAGLIPVQAYGRDVLRGIRELRNAATADAREQDGCILLFSFRKDRNPRICAVKYVEGRRVVFPPACEAGLAFFSPTLWEWVQRSAPVVEGADPKSYYFEARGREGAAGESVHHDYMLSTMNTEVWPEVWFGALPSILYNWAGGTLQEGVSQGRLHDWSVDQHYELGCRVLRGVDTLHGKKFIHGDLRPANIMTCGAANTPDEYVVGDYGSFSDDYALVSGAPPSEASGHTMVGGLGRHRTSVFYAPERRAGVERETADVALILSELKGAVVDDEYLIYFGWRSQILDPETNCPAQAVLDDLRERWRQMLGAASDEAWPAPVGDRLTRGDRLRVREFIFTVIDAHEFEDDEHVEAGARGRRMVYRCRARFTQVLHERITVFYNGSRLPDCSVIGLPNFVELRQWSAATDLYGTGALILYTVFMSGQRRSASAELADREQGTGDSMGTAETMLTEMLEMLEGVPSFLALWSDLEDFCWSLEHPGNATLSGAELARAEIGHRHGILGAVARQGLHDDVLPSEDPNEHRTIGGFARRTINNLLRSVPNIRCVLQVFECGDGEPSADGSAVTAYNAAHFLLFIHFVMACLHRRSHLRHLGDVTPRYPFCRDRCDPAVPGGPARDALMRLEELRRRLLQPRYEAIVVHDRQLVDFDPRDVMQIRIEHAQLLREAAIRRREQAECQRQLDEALARLGERERSCSESQDEIERKMAELHTAEQARAQAASEASRLRGELLGVQAVLARTHEEATAARDTVTSLEASGAQTQAEVTRLGNGLSDREKRLADALTRCATLEAQLRERSGELARLTTSSGEREAALHELERRVETHDSKIFELMAQLEASMGGCIDDLEAIDRAAWRVPTDRMERLNAVLGQWRAWGQKRHAAMSRRQALTA